MSRSVHRVIAGAAVAALATGLLAPATSAATPLPSGPTLRPGAPSGAAVAGLFGSQDATFDGTYRQTLSLLALQGAGVTPPRASVRWLLRQQCDDGAFQAYRDDLSQPCSAPDPVAFTGRDSNSTALAAMALRGAGETTAARRAIRWLRSDQNPDGGWDYVEGAGSDANSTGLALAALRANGVRPTTVTRNGRSGADFLATLRLGCTAARADRGALAFQAFPGSPLLPNALSSAQGLVGLTGSLPVARTRLTTEQARLRCDGSTESGRTPLPAAVAGYLSRALQASGGALPDAFGSGEPDWTATSSAVLALVSAGRGREQVGQAMTRLGSAVRSYTRDDDGARRPAALASLILAAVATGRDARDFGRGGTDLVAALLATRQR